MILSSVFQFNTGELLAFFIGIVAGFAILALIYALLVLVSTRKKHYDVETQALVASDEELYEIINNATEAFNDQTLRGSKSIIAHTKDICFSLVFDISRKFYPKSKRPYAELSVDEMLRLVKYVADRVDEMIDKPALRLVKKVKLSTILSLGDAKKVIDESTLMKVTKKYKIKQALGAFWSAVNILNPVYWIKKLFINNSLDFALKKICLVIIKIVGEETVKIYSKRVFDEERVIDTNIKEDVESIDDLKDMTDEEIDDYLNSEIKKRRD